MTRLTDSLKEPGLALVTALLVVVLVGALILGVFTTSVADYRISRNLLFQEQALAAAEYGQNDVLRSWDTSWVHTMQPGNVTVRPVSRRRIFRRSSCRSFWPWAGWNRRWHTRGARSRPIP